MGDGHHTHLWHDCWCGDTNLKEVFPVLFECAVDCDASVAFVLIRQNGGIEWNFNDWELDGVTA